MVVNAIAALVRVGGDTGLVENVTVGPGGNPMQHTQIAAYEKVVVVGKRIGLAKLRRAEGAPIDLHLLHEVLIDAKAVALIDGQHVAREDEAARAGVRKRARRHDIGFDKPPARTALNRYWPSKATLGVL